MHSRRKPRGLRFALVLGLAGVMLQSAAADDGIRSQRVEFAKGASSAVVEGTIKGYEIVDYLLRAAQGQTMNVSMATGHGATYFNILAPGETEVAFFNGSVGDNQFEGELPATGDYRVRVYMLRSAARRGEAANYRLEMIITGPVRGVGDHDALVPGADFHATTRIPCVVGPNQPMGQCEAGVKRVPNGGTVHI